MESTNNDYSDIPEELLDALVNAVRRAISTPDLPDLPAYKIAVSHPLDISSFIEAHDLGEDDMPELTENVSLFIAEHVVMLAQALNELGVDSYQATVDVRELDKPVASVIVFLKDDSSAMDLSDALDNANLWCEHVTSVITPMSEDGVVKFSADGISG